MRGDSSYQTGEKFVRVVGMFDMLMGTQVGKTSQEIAEELGVDVRSVQRYIRQMAEAGLDIVRDDHGRYRVGEGSRLPPMQFSKHEGVAVLVALRLLQQMRATRDDALIGAVARLAKAMKVATVTSYLGTMIEAAAAQPAGGGLERIESVVVGCFVDRIPCEIAYKNTAGELTKRTIRPYFLEPRAESRTLYVFALDSRSRTVRCFRMDQIRQARAVPIEGTYVVPEDFDITEITRSSWGVWQAGDQLEEVRLRFSPEIAARVRRSVWHPSAVLEDRADGGVDMRLHIASAVEIRPWVLGWGSLVEVLGPESLREHVAESMREGMRMYDLPGSSPT